MIAAIAHRVDLLEEAAALEAANGTWSIRHVCAVLNCHRATLYRTAWLRSRMIDGPGVETLFHPGDIRLFQANRKGRK